MPQIIVKRRRGYKQQVEELRQQYAELRRRHDRLLQIHSSLLLENAVVTSLCESLSSLDFPAMTCLQKQQEQKQEQVEQDVTVCKQHQKLTEHHSVEDQLLQQLCSMPPRQADHVQLLTAASTDARHNPTIAPAHQPMAMATTYTSRTLDAATVHSLTSMDMTLLYKETIQQLAVPLQLLEAGMLAPDLAALRIEKSFDRLWCTLFSLVVMGRGPLIREYCIRNAETMELNPAAFVEQAPRVAAAVSKMQLTAQQEEAIARHWPVWMRLLAPLKEEYQALQQQVCAADEPGTRTDAVPSSAASSTTTACAASANGTPEGGLGSAQQGGVKRAAEIEARMQRLGRLELVLHKMSIINNSCMCWMMGRFSWVQLAKLAVLTWPYPTTLDSVGAAIRSQWEKRCQHDQEQRQQQLQAAVDDSIAVWGSVLQKELVPAQARGSLRAEQHRD